jgi:MFS family permease
VQGLGAAMLMPQTLAIVTMVFPPERRGAAFGIWGAVAGLATIAGPTLGGMRWTMVLPITVVALAAASCLLLPNKASGQGPVTVTDAEPGQMAGTISSPGSSGSAGHSPGSSSGMTS